jgi:phosphoribosylformylglycinamidine synthase
MEMKCTRKLNGTEKAITDVYWSDHCRHTTFNTPLEFEGAIPDIMRPAFELYEEQRRYVHGEKTNKPMTLMDLATIGAKEQRKKGNVPNLVDDVHEQNACTIEVIVNDEPYRISFKNETHNSPTEIVPYDGAATCAGGLQRDLLAARGRPYDGIRITGSADPVCGDTMPGKLPQRQITTEAAQGFRDYMDGLGLRTGYIHEIYHPGYAAKRMELGFGVSAVKSGHVRIEQPAAGDIVILIGARTGRDGIGGATDSSRQQDERSVKDDAVRVPKGVPETERRIIELYADPEFLALVKRCNDFGAGGVSVAVGEIADGLDIFLDKVPLKEGQEDMTPCEIAISESQERMAVVVAEKDSTKVMELCERYGLDAAHVADVTDTGYMNMYHNGIQVVSLERNLLNNPELPDVRRIMIRTPDAGKNPFLGKKYDNFRDMVIDTMGDPENCSQQGLVQMFDRSNDLSVLPAYDGITKKTRTQGTVSIIPAEGNRSAVTIAAYGYDPYVAEWSPFHGGQMARLDSMAKVIALGGDRKDIFFTDQEYYATPVNSEKMGAPFAALLGANHISAALGRPAVGGKDSMSGSYKDIDVPPTLVSFAIADGDIKNVRSQAFQAPGSKVGVILVTQDDGSPIDTDAIKKRWDHFIGLRNAGKILSARALGAGGMISEVVNGCLGNETGFTFEDSVSKDILNGKYYGGLLFEIADGAEFDPAIVRVIGHTTDEKTIRLGEESVKLDDILKVSESRLASVFPIRTD